ncbi:hypothetical protein NL676_034686 [Syzygium grande]|nr:hypothetical protein NL676_034686 [Syzygium grande]
MESSCTPLDSVSSLLSIVASLVTIIAFFPRILHVRGLDTHAQVPAPGLPAGQRESGGGRAQGGSGEGQDDAGGQERGPDQEPEEKGEGGGELLEAVGARAERNDKYGGGMREECELNGRWWRRRRW